MSLPVVRAVSAHRATRVAAVHHVLDVGKHELLHWEKEFNTVINRTRAVVERVIANFKNWRILHTDYRRPLDTFATTISAAIGLIFYSLT